MIIEDNYPIDRFVARFVAGETSPYGSWGENVAGWLATRYGRPGFLLLRYEDMVRDTVSELAKVASFLELGTSPQRLVEAVERSAADKMRELERKQASKWSSTRETRQDIPFVRVAKPGRWQSDLPENCVAMIEASWGPLLDWLGYIPAHGHATEKPSLLHTVADRASLGR